MLVVCLLAGILSIASFPGLSLCGRFKKCCCYFEDLFRSRKDIVKIKTVYKGDWEGTGQ